jgi:U3 small nucleolar RNA-associated protein 14
MPKEEDLTLPGWVNFEILTSKGSWGGIGLKPQKQRMVVKSIPGIEAEKRKDAKLKHVIINEKRLKKSIQYLVPQVPHGFENRDQYERTIRMPIGKEWNTQNVYLEKIAPRIQKKLGQAIHPIRFVSSGKKKTSRRKL